MKNNPVNWFEIYVQDLARAKQFYESVFRTKLNKLNTPESTPGLELWAFPAEMNLGGAGGAIVKMDGVSPGNNSTLVYFSCEDCSIEEGRVKEVGGRVHRSKTSIGEYGAISLVFDTEGNMFGLHSMH